MDALKAVLQQQVVWQEHVFRPQCVVIQQDEERVVVRKLKGIVIIAIIVAHGIMAMIPTHAPTEKEMDGILHVSSIVLPGSEII